MKRIIVLLGFLALFTNSFSQDFKYAFVSDTHVGSPTGEDDLRRTITDINSFKDLDFVIFTGDITEFGSNNELKLAKEIISKLKIPYYIIPGNHDTGWSESGGVTFIKEFGYDKISFDHKGYRFIGCASGPYVRMSDGHIPRDAQVWLDSILSKTDANQPVIFFNHYPINEELDNWYSITDRLHAKNTQYIICGHGHTNKALTFEDIPATMGRSNLRAKAEIGGYNIVEMHPDTVTFSERTPGVATQAAWRKIALGERNYLKGQVYKRPLYTENVSFPQAKAVWMYQSDANVVSTPAVVKGNVIFGNSIGTVEAVSLDKGKKVWSFKTGGAIYSSAEAKGKRVVIGSGDGNIYCLDARDGKLIWKLKTGASVLGAVSVDGNVAYVGGSDHTFRAIDIKSGRQIWSYNGLQGPVVSKPLIYDGKVFFGAWDMNFYALDQRTGHLLWKWDHQTTNRMLSPAMVNPVATDGVVYIVAPDKYLSAIDAQTGKTIWRTNETTIRESLGISIDKKLLFGKTMNDEIVAFYTGKVKPQLAWKLNAGFGYEHVPSMLIQKGNTVYFGTKNGVVYAIDNEGKTVKWAHKLDNSMINTVNVIKEGKLVAATMDGVVALIESQK